MFSVPVPELEIPTGSAQYMVMVILSVGRRFVNGFIPTWSVPSLTVLSIKSMKLESVLIAMPVSFWAVSTVISKFPDVSIESKTEPAFLVSVVMTPLPAMGKSMHDERNPMDKKREMQAMVLRIVIKTPVRRLSAWRVFVSGVSRRQTPFPGL